MINKGEKIKIGYEIISLLVEEIKEDEVHCIISTDGVIPGKKAIFIYE